MNRLTDFLRTFFISPEILVFLSAFALSMYWPEPAAFTTQQIALDLKWGFGAALVPICFLAASYRIGTDVLSPQGARKALLDWPDYWMLKTRVILSMVFCGICFFSALVGFYIIAKDKSPAGATVLLASLLSSSASLATVALAAWKIREIFRE
jgi:hypothetical protein